MLEGEAGVPASEQHRSRCAGEGRGQKAGRWADWELQGGRWPSTARGQERQDASQPSEQGGVAYTDSSVLRSEEAGEESETGMVAAGVMRSTGEEEPEHHHAGPQERGGHTGNHHAVLSRSPHPCLLARPQARCHMLSLSKAPTHVKGPGHGLGQCLHQHQLALFRQAPCSWVLLPPPWRSAQG